ncbi:hypothetical protein BH18ACT7_BH18ACT7_05540 [soil metagenome]
MNQSLTAVLAATTDPAAETDEAVRVRERLAHAGLLAMITPRTADLDDTAVQSARRRAGRGTSLADLVASERG